MYNVQQQFMMESSFELLNVLHNFQPNAKRIRRVYLEKIQGGQKV